MINCRQLIYGETLQGTYGSGETPCEVYSYKKWYCVQGSLNVNRTHEPLTEGVNVEMLEDFDCFTAQDPIDSLDELIDQVNN